ncbi:hypothetical protein [Corallococcus sp. CA049B]|uniref:hypothetical protein n=1 Tax=Corallococcus sp. CA049B TaxID=2316730 RepID=UPI001F28C5D7|nr:hypothetical protein [Corallococcus sp. CA049B]
MNPVLRDVLEEVRKRPLSGRRCAMLTTNSQVYEYLLNSTKSGAGTIQARSTLGTGSGKE